MPTVDTAHSTTQQFLDIFDITNDLVILKDGTTSLILTVDAMNFGLLAEEEQDSIMYAYAGLLNSLNYSIQIIIRSQTKDVTGYLQLLKDQEDKSSDRMQQQRIRKYREFVSNLIRERNVLDKKFYVVIPAKPLELGILPPSSILPGKAVPNITGADRNIILEKAKNLLEPKRDHLIAQFARIGLYSRQLETQEIIQLFYLSYNPEASEGQHMGESKAYTTPLVSAATTENQINSLNNSPSLVQQQIEQPTVMSQTQKQPSEQNVLTQSTPEILPQTQAAVIPNQEPAQPVVQTEAAGMPPVAEIT